MKTKRIALIAIAFVFLSSTIAITTEKFVTEKPKKVYILKSFVHSHTVWSDGSLKVDELAKKVRQLGYRVIMFTDHSDLHINDHPDSFWWYQKETQSWNKDGDFVVLTCREITIGPAKDSNDHLGACSFTSTPFLYNPKLGFDQVMGLVNKEDGSITIYHHPRTNTKWCNQVWKFSGIELFNDPFDERVDQDCYIRALRAGYTGFVTGGIDYHLGPFAEIATWIFAESITRQGVIDALKNSRTIATANVTRLLTSSSPSKLRQSKKTLRITFTVSSGTPVAFIVYKGGYEYESKNLTGGGPNTYYFDFTPTISGCYVFRVPNYMTTSSYCY